MFASYSAGSAKCSPILSLNLSTAVFGETVLHESKGSAPIAISETGMHQCEECGESVTPIPHPTNDRAEWWFPCCSFFCESCDCVERFASYSQCTKCERCSSCCNCAYCEACCEPVDYNCSECGIYCESCCDGHNQCENCGEPVDCGCCSLCIYCSEDAPSYGSQTIPGWVKRGDILPTHIVPNFVPVLARTVNPSQGMAEFYLAEFVSAALTTTYPAVRSAWNNGLRNAAILNHKAESHVVKIVETFAPIFREYAFMAIGGELRYHDTARETLSGDRYGAWDAWHAMGQTIPRHLLLADAMELFGDGSWGPSYGGPKWEACAKVAWLYETGAIDARTFVDRCFALQHNSGSFLNKVSWKDGSDTHMMIAIGNAHAAPIPSLSLLLRYSSPAVRAMVAELQASFLNVWRKVLAGSMPWEESERDDYLRCIPHYSPCGICLACLSSPETPTERVLSGYSAWDRMVTARYGF